MYLAEDLRTRGLSGGGRYSAKYTEDFQLSSSETAFGITDVHSGSDQTALDSSPYTSW
jgi:hypothetical protein